MNSTIKTTFGEHKLAITVGADSLSAKVDVPQPAIKIRVSEEVEYEFDQQKFEEYLSSSRFASPRRSRKVRWSSDTKTRQDDICVTDATPVTSDAPSASDDVKNKDLNSSSMELVTDDVSTLSKRTRQRRRWRLTRQLAKALEPVDGIRYEADLKFRRHQSPQQRVDELSPLKTMKNEWVSVKRTRSTLQERIQKRRALLAQARVLVQKAKNLQKKEVQKKPQKLHQVWRPKYKMEAKSDPPSRGSLKSDPPSRGSSKSDPPSRGSPKSDPPIRGSPKSDPPTCGSLKFDPQDRRHSASVSSIPSSSAPPVTPLVKPRDHVDLSQLKTKITGRLGPSRNDRGKAPVKERLGPLNGSRAAGCHNHPSK